MVNIETRELASNNPELNICFSEIMLGVSNTNKYFGPFPTWPYYLCAGCVIGQTVKLILTGSSQNLGKKGKNGPAPYTVTHSY